ncbi:uncharacterized protein TNCV_2444381 [Trichonephila clavipes]|nr:uncharacterized protein TNCV_2444381 [Trichonephila clavipes]
MEIRIGSSDSNSSRHESSSFDRVQRRSNKSQYGRKKGSGVERELEEKGISFLRKIRVRDTQVRAIRADHLSDQHLALGLRPVERSKGKEGPNRRKSNPQHKRLQPQTTKRGVPTNHGEENTTRTTSLSQEKQRMELQHLHRRASKTGQQEYQTIRKSTTKGPGKERRSEYKQNHMSGGPNRRRQLQVIKTIL